MYSVKDKEVVEKETGNVIQVCLNEAKANELCRKLNLGSGFQGWTPTFMLPKKKGYQDFS